MTNQEVKVYNGLPKISYFLNKWSFHIVSSLIFILNIFKKLSKIKNLYTHSLKISIFRIQGVPQIMTVKRNYMRHSFVHLLLHLLFLKRYRPKLTLSQGFSKNVVCLFVLSILQEIFKILFRFKYYRRYSEFCSDFNITGDIQNL